MINKNPDKIHFLFNEIAEYYDKMNFVISLGTQYFIKKQAVKLLNIKENSKVLDLCTGTGDIVKIISNMHKNIDITGVDIAENMLEIAKKKNKGKKFLCADVINLPFKENEFDYITITFGLRNINEREKAIKEIKRVLKKDGLCIHLDFGYHNFISKCFDVFVLTLLKILKINKKNYEYLINSKNDYPEPDILIKEFENEGLRLIEKKNFLFSSISAEVFIKP